MNYLLSFTKKYKVILIIVILIIIKVCFSLYNNSIFYKDLSLDNIEEDASKTNEEKVENSEVKTVFVDVKGAVENPGLYEVDSSYRVGQVIEEAGGFSHANTQCVNLSQKIQDEQLIYIPDKSQMCETQENNSQNNVKEEKDNESIESLSLININTATQEELMSLTGIGESRADDIIKYRNENGSFIAKEDIKNVTGIGDSIYEDIKDEITV